ncbi:MAG: PEP-CTERM sorting domain-containing protein, partial [Rubrivivax sp.]|nr:PEP-CTERM sorting domain-containing protein [Rubrivivax sp.]
MLFHALQRAAVAAAITTAAFATHAGSVTLTGWAYDKFGVVEMTHPTNASKRIAAHAGAFAGVVGGFDGDTAAFNGALVTYCVELTQNAPGWNTNQGSYLIVDGGDYFGSGRAEELGSFVTFLEPLIATASDQQAWRLAVAGQLAIWNLIYDTDASLTGGTMREHGGKGGNHSGPNPKPSYRELADTLLGDWETWSEGGNASAYDVFVLQHSSKQDYLLLRERPVPSASLDVPEPGSLALVAGALCVAGFARTRR